MAAEHGTVIRRSAAPAVAGLLGVATLVAWVWLDQPVALAVQHLGQDARSIARLFSALGDSAWILIPSGALLLLRRFGALRRLPAIVLARSRQLFWLVAGTGLLADVIKGVIARPRPRVWLREGVTDPRFFHWFDAAWASMPSGHTVTAFTLAFVLARWYPRWALAAFAIASGVGLARVALGVHYLSDAVAGAALAIVCCALVERTAWWRASPGDPDRRAGLSA